MKRTILSTLTVLAALALAACATHPLTIPSLGSNSTVTVPMLLEVHRLIAEKRADIVNAKAMAVTGGDIRGAQCHATGLVAIDSIFNMPNVQLTGAATIAESARLLRLSQAKNAMLWQQLDDDCSPVYNWRGLFGPILHAAGGTLP